MKVLHTIEGFGAKFGGIATCTYDLLNSMQKEVDTVHLLSPELRDDSDINLGAKADWALTYPNDGKGPFNYSSNLKRRLRSSDYEIYHANGMWQYIVHATCRHARSHNKPYVITPHGMLYPEAMRRSYWKKWPLMHLWFNKDIMNASCIHVTCEQEMTHIRNLGYRGPIALIGNPVPVSKEISDIFSSRADSPFLGCSHTRKLGFLGRLHPIKKCEALLYGVASRPKADICVVIMGSGDTAYETFLHREAERLGIADRVQFVGFVTGKAKYEALAGLSALFVPSDMENFGMIVPEALLVGTPVMASLGTPWKSLNDNRCGWWTDNTPEAIAEVIDEICAATPRQLFDMGSRGRQMVLDNFEAGSVAHKMSGVYNWLVNGDKKPDCIYEY